MRPEFVAVAAVCTSLVTSMASGQTSALRGHNTNAPVNFDADRIEVQDRADRVVLSGNVVVRQAQLTLTAARITAIYTDTRGIQVKRLDASGGVTVRSPSETARGQYAIYDTGSRLITMLGGVTLTRGASQVRGGRLVLDLESGRAVVDGGGRSSSGPAGTTTQGGRVTGTFTVPQRR